MRNFFCFHSLPALHSPLSYHLPSFLLASIPFPPPSHYHHHHHLTSPLHSLPPFASLQVIHGSLVIGPPPAWSSWPSFFNNIAYLLCFDVMGIAEVEHNLLRAEMSHPSTLLSKVPSPQTLFPDVALTQRDFRLNFCINTGSLSMLPYVPVYTLATFDSQLDEVRVIVLLPSLLSLCPLTLPFPSSLTRPSHLPPHFFLSLLSDNLSVP
jgi:Protein of unknown function, DUF547